MALRQFSEMYDLILPYVPAVELPLVDYHIRRVTREFCRRTTLWRRRVNITTQAGVNDYLLSPYDAADQVEGASTTGWVPVADQSTVSVTLTSGIGSAPGWYVNQMGDYAIEWATSGTFGEVGNPVSWTVQVSPPAPIRVNVENFYESFPSVVYDPHTSLFVPSMFEFDGGAYFFNATPQEPFGGDIGVFQSGFLPSNMTAGESAAVSYINYYQGNAGEVNSYATGRVTFDVFVQGNPVICDPYSIISVVCDGRPLPVLPEDRRLPHGARPNDGTPRAWYSPSARVVHLYPTPAGEHELEVDIVCALTMFPHNPVMPEFLFVDYREVIADGVVASLKMLGNKPWFDPEGAAIFGRRFASAVNGLRAKLRDGNQPNASVMRGPRFGK